MSLAYIPGCMLEGSAREYDLATRAVFARLDVELTELPGWNCCGGTSAASFDRRTWLDLNRRNIELARNAGDEAVLACPICMRNLNEAKREVAREEDAASGGRQGGHGPVIRSVAEVLAQDEMIERIRAKAQEDLKGLRAAAYYGCQLSRKGTERIIEDRPIEKIVESFGGETVEWSGATACCGGSIAYAATEALSCIEGVLRAAQEARAHAIVTICPLCHLNLDARQDELTAARDAFFKLPVFHVTELLGIVLGIAEAEFWIRRHMTSVMDLIFRLDRERDKSKNAVKEAQDRLPT